MANSEIDNLLAVNALYTDNKAVWQYMQDSYLGGQVYRKAGYLTNYTNETSAEYNQRLLVTPLDNHCASVISVYNSFLFRVSPTRTFVNLTEDETNPFLADADFDGRSLDNFMKDVATWSSVFGHVWTVLVKPNTNAGTRADELAQDVRPYINLLTPLSVTDWAWTRQENGLYVLTYFKYIEGVRGSQITLKEWTPDFVRTVTIDKDEDEIVADLVEENGLGTIPAVIAYNQRSPIRGIGLSDINDIADEQRLIYNLNSEMEQGIRLEGHPSLVATVDTLEKAGSGAGAIIAMPENMDPQLKPFMLVYDGAPIDAVLKVIEKSVTAIDKMANTGAVRATEVRTLSGVAMETEFQLLNARLSDKANNLELAEEQIWRLFALYEEKAFGGTIEYPGSFNIQDLKNEFAQLVTAKSAATDPKVHQLIDRKVVELFGDDAEIILGTPENPGNEQ